MWVIHTKDGLSEYRRRRELETARIPGFRDGDCFHDGQEVLATMANIHKTLIDDIRPHDHVTGAILEVVAKEMLIDADIRTPAKLLSYRTKGILQDAETKLRRSASNAGTGRVSRTTQSPPPTPPEPPPDRFRPRSYNSHSQFVPSHVHGGSPTSISYDIDEPHHQTPSVYLFGQRTSHQADYRDRPTRRQPATMANHPSYGEIEDQYQFFENGFNRAFSEFDPSPDGPSSPSWQGPLNTHRRRRRTPSNFSGANTGNVPDLCARERQGTYNASRHDSFTGPPGEVSTTSTATLIQDLHSGS